MSLLFGHSPELLLSLARAASQSCAKETVCGSVATAIHFFFPTVKYCSVQLSVVSNVLMSFENLVVEGRCLVKLLPVQQSLAGLCYQSKSLVSTNAQNISAQEKYLDVDHALRTWDVECHVSVPLFFDATMEVVGKAVELMDQVDMTDDAAARVVLKHYIDLERSVPVIGTLTVGMPKVHAISERELANFVLLGCALAINLSLDCQDLLKEVGDVVANLPAGWASCDDNPDTYVIGSATSSSWSHWSETSEENNDTDTDTSSRWEHNHSADAGDGEQNDIDEADWVPVGSMEYSGAYTDDEGGTEDEDEGSAGDDCKQFEMPSDHRRDEGDSSNTVPDEEVTACEPEDSGCRSSPSEACDFLLGYESEADDGKSNSAVPKQAPTLQQHPFFLNFTDVRVENNYSCFAARQGRWADMLWIVLHLSSLVVWLSEAFSVGNWGSCGAQWLNLIVFFTAPWPLLWPSRFAPRRDTWLCMMCTLYLLVEIFQGRVSAITPSLGTRSMILMALLQVRVRGFVWVCAAYVLIQGLLAQLLSSFMSVTTDAAASTGFASGFDLLLVVVPLLAVSYVIERRSRWMFVKSTTPSTSA